MVARQGRRSGHHRRIFVVDLPTLRRISTGYFPALKSEYIDTGKVRYIEREFPLNNPALAGSVIARCVDPSRFYAFTDLLFSKQEDWAFKDDAMQAPAAYTQSKPG